MNFSKHTRNNALFLAFLFVMGPIQAFAAASACSLPKTVRHDLRLQTYPMSQPSRAYVALMAPPCSTSGMTKAQLQTNADYENSDFLKMYEDDDLSAAGFARCAFSTHNVYHLANFSTAAEVSGAYAVYAGVASEAAPVAELKSHAIHLWLIGQWLLDEPCSDATDKALVHKALEALHDAHVVPPQWHP